MPAGNRGGAAAWVNRAAHLRAGRAVWFGSFAYADFGALCAFFLLPGKLKKTATQTTKPSRFFAPWRRPSRFFTSKLAAFTPHSCRGEASGLSRFQKPKPMPRCPAPMSLLGSPQPLLGSPAGEKTKSHQGMFLLVQKGATYVVTTKPSSLLLHRRRDFYWFNTEHDLRRHYETLIAFVASPKGFFTG